MKEKETKTAIERESMVFFRSFYEALKDLPVESRDASMTAIIEYGLDGRIPSKLDNYGKIAFAFAKPIIESANARYISSVENGKKGGRPKKSPPQAQNPQKPGHNLNENGNEKDNENVNENANVNMNANESKAALPSAEQLHTHAHGEYKNVFLLDSEKDMLTKELGKEIFDKSVTFLSRYLARKPRHSSARHFEDLRGWVQKAMREQGVIPDKVKKNEYKDKYFDLDFEDIYEKP